MCEVSRHGYLAMHVEKGGGHGCEQALEHAKLDVVVWHVVALAQELHSPCLHTACSALSVRPAWVSGPAWVLEPAGRQRVATGCSPPQPAGQAEHESSSDGHVVVGTDAARPRACDEVARHPGRVPGPGEAPACPA